MTDLLEYIKKMQEMYGEDVITTADKINRPDPKPIVKEIKAINEFVKRNPRADGGRIGFKRGKQAVQLTGKKFIEIVEKFPNKNNKELLEYFNKNNFVNRYGKPLNLGSIKTQKSKLFDLASEKAAQVPKGYISSAEVFENLPISKADYFRVKQAKEGGTLLTQEIDKLLKPQKVGAQQFYFKKPSKSDMKSFNRLADKTGRLNNRIADLMLEFDKAYGKQFVKGNIPKIEDVVKKFNITDSTAAKVTTRLAQWYGGQDFKNPQLQKLQRNKVASNRMFKTIEKSAFGNPYRQGLYEISLQTIDAKLGNKQGTFQNLKDKAKQILKDNNIAVYDPKMGKNAFGFNINEIAGVTGSAKSKAAEFSQFIDIMEGNLNTKALAGFQSKLSTARQIIEKDPSQLSVQSKKINKMAKNLEKKYDIKLPRLRDPDATKYFTDTRLKQLKAQDLDIVKAAERAGYTIEMPKGAITAKEFTKLNDKKMLNFLEKNLSSKHQQLIKDKFCGNAAGGKPGSCSINEAMDNMVKQTNAVKQGTVKGAEAARIANKASKVARFGTGKGLAKVLGPYGLAAEALFEIAFAVPGYAKGKTGKRLLGDSIFGLIPGVGQSAEEEFAEYATKAGMSELEQQKIKDANRFLELNQSLIDAEKAGVLEGRGVGRGAQNRGLQNYMKLAKEYNPLYDQFVGAPPSQDVSAFLAEQDKINQLIQADQAERAEKRNIALEEDFMAAEGGIASGPPPTGGPMSQGLRSLYNNGRKL
jgi:hypothetical protein